MKIKHYIRNLVAETLQVAGITSAARLHEHLTVVTFHRVLSEAQCSQYPLRGLSVTPEMLNEFASYFATNFECVTVTNGVRQLQHRSRKSSRPLLSITFDDGRMDNFVQARSILNAHQIAGTFYVPAGFVGSVELLWHDAVGYAVSNLVQSGRSDLVCKLMRTNMRFADGRAAAYWVANQLKSFHENDRRQIESHFMRHSVSTSPPAWETSMDWSQLQQLVDDGHEIGSHTMTHAILGPNQAVRLRDEIFESKELLQQQLGTSITSFSYPTGTTCQESENMVREAGYQNAVTTASGCNSIRQDVMKLKRINLQADQNQSANGKLNTAVLSWRMTNDLRDE